MGKPSWTTKRDTGYIGGAFTTIPPIIKKSGKDFRPPATIEDDFRRLLEHDVPHVNFTFELIRDWYDTFAEDYEPVYIRAQQTPIDWKSKIGNSDVSTNFKVTHDIPIHKGDIVIREDGKVFLLNWAIQYHPNNQATQSAECNLYFTVRRRRQAITDDLGYAVDDSAILDQDELGEMTLGYEEPGNEGYDTIVDAIPAIQTEYQGRPDFTSNQGQPGITANHLIEVSVQWNEQTRKVRIGDLFDVGSFTYIVENINVEQTDIIEPGMDITHGLVKFQARRQAGGELADG